MSEGLFDGGQNTDQERKFQGIDIDLVETILHTPTHAEDITFDYADVLAWSEDDTKSLGLPQHVRTILDREVPVFEPAEPPVYVHVPRESRTKYPPKPPRYGGPSGTAGTLRDAMLPPGRVIPESVAEFAGVAANTVADTIVEHKAQVAAGAAVVVATALVGGIGSAGITSASKEVVAALDRPAAVAAPAPARPSVAEVVQVDFRYTPTSETTPKQIANVMQASSKKIAEENPGAINQGTIPAGSTVGGTVKASKVQLVAPVNAERLAKAYGLTPEAILSVNTANANGLLSGEVLIPGRQVVEMSGASFDVSSVEQKLQLSEVGRRELRRLNEWAPDGQIVFQLSDAIEENLPQIADVAVAAVVQPTVGSATTAVPNSPAATPVTAGSPATTEAAPANSTSTTTEAGTTTTAVAPKGSKAITTTAPVGVSTEDEAPVQTTVVPAAEVPTESTTTLPTPLEAQAAPAAAEATPAAPDVAPAPVPVERPASEQEKHEADKKAFQAALEIARTTGDAGPLNHIIFYSPLFRPAGLPDSLQTGEIRYLPPSDFLDIPGLVYEFSTNTPANERYLASTSIAVITLAAYTMQIEKATNPAYQAIADSCLRVGDLTARKGHVSHDGDEADLTSSMHCNINDGHDSADGPIFWINHQEGGINTRVSNPNYNAQLEKTILQVMLRANIGGVPILKNILYNALGLGIPKVTVFSNHNHHIHLNATNNAHRGGALKKWADGGGRPEFNRAAWQAMLYLSYAGGMGVPGVSLDLKITEFVSTPANLDPTGGVVVAAGQVAPAPTPAPTTTATPPTTAAPTPAPDPAPAIPEMVAAPAVPEVDYRTILPATADIPAQFIPLITPSKHFTAIELAAQIRQESRFNPLAKSSVGASGIAQFMPGTWKVLGRDTPLDADTVADPRNVVEALDAQRRYMDGQYELIQGLINEGKIKGDPRQLTLAAYNAGLGNVRKYGGLPPFAETRGYIKSIDKNIQYYLQHIDAELAAAGKK